MQAGGQALAHRHLLARLDGVPLLILQNAVAAGQHRQRADRFQRCGLARQGQPALVQPLRHGAVQPVVQPAQLLGQGRQPWGGVEPVQSRFQSLNGLGPRAQLAVHGAVESQAEFIQTLGMLLQLAARVIAAQSGGQQGQALTLMAQLANHRLSQTLAVPSQPVQSQPRVLTQQLCRCRRCRGAQVRHVVGDGGVDLVAHGADDGQPRLIDRPGHRFFVKAPEILQTAAAAGQQDGVHLVAGVGGVDGLADLCRGLCPLNGGGVEDHLQHRVAPFQHRQHILNRRAAGAGDYPQALDGVGQGLLGLHGKQTLPSQLHLQGFKTLLQ